MSLGQLLMLHLMAGAGAGVAGAVYLTARRRTYAALWFQVVSALLFWPMYLPVLLSRQATTTGDPETGDIPPAAADDLGRIIAQVDSELDHALGSLDGWAEDVLARENGRLLELRSAWTSQAQRIRDMDRLLERPEYALAGEPLALPGAIDPGDRLRASQEVIRQNIERLRQVRQRTYADLLGTLSWVRELASMIHLAKFTGAPPSRAEELVAQIAAAVEGLSALTWEDDRAVKGMDWRKKVVVTS